MYLFSLGANPLVRWVLLDKLRAFFPFHGSIHHRLPRSDNWVNLFNHKHVADLQYHFFLWRFKVEHEENDEEHQTAFMPAFLTVYLRDTVMADWIWEKKNVISISIKWRIWDLEKSMSTIQYLPSWSRWLLLMCTLSIISRGSYEQNWNGLTIAHSSSTTRSFSGPSFADFNMHHPPSSESITSISRVEAEAQAARFRWFNPSLTVTTLSVVIVKNEWWCSHGGLSAKKCDCGDWTCGLAICVGWEMNQSLIYEVTQHSLPSVLAQLSSLQSHPAQQVALWTW